MYEYIKIPNIFKREQFGNNKLLDGQYSSHELEYLQNCQWIWTEKIDGTNIRIIWDGYRVSIKGRTDNSQIPPHLLQKLEEMFLGTPKEEVFEQKFGNQTAVLYGEGYGEKIQNGGAYGPVNFILFDVNIDGWWLKRSGIVEIAGYFDLNVVPIVGHGTLPEAVEYIKGHPKSVFKNETMEGIVAKPFYDLFDRGGKRIITKVKCVDF